MRRTTAATAPTTIPAMAPPLIGCVAFSDDVILSGGVAVGRDSKSDDVKLAESVADNAVIDGAGFAVVVDDVLDPIVAIHYKMSANLIKPNLFLLIPGNFLPVLVVLAVVDFLVVDALVVGLKEQYPSYSFSALVTS